MAKKKTKKKQAKTQTSREKLEAAAKAASALDDIEDLEDDEDDDDLFEDDEDDEFDDSDEEEDDGEEEWELEDDSDEEEEDDSDEEEEDAAEEDEASDAEPAKDPPTPAGKIVDQPGYEDDEEETYVVQSGYNLNGDEYVTGDVVPVSCQHCALWQLETPLGMLCHPKRQVDTDDKKNPIFMTPDRWSCQDFFVSRELSGAVDKFIGLELPVLNLFKKVATVHATKLRGQERALEWFEQKCQNDHPALNAEEAIENVEAALEAFTTSQQMDLATGFFNEYSGLAKRRQSNNAKKKFRFALGDTVGWTDRSTGQDCEGYVAKNAAGLIALICVKGPHAGVTMSFKLKDFRQSYAPSIVKKGVHQQHTDAG